METDIFKRPICMKLQDVEFKLDGAKHTVNQNDAAVEFVKRTKAAQYSNNGLIEITFIGTEYECRLALVAAFTKTLANTPGGSCLSVHDFSLAITVAVQEPSNRLSCFREWSYSYGTWDMNTLASPKLPKDEEERLRCWFGLTPTK